MQVRDILHLHLYNEVFFFDDNHGGAAPHDLSVSEPKRNTEMKSIAKFIVALAAMALVVALLSTVATSWVAWGVGLLVCYLILRGDKIFDDGDILGCIAIVVAIAGLWWFYFDVFSPWIGRVTGYDNMGADILLGIIALLLVGGLIATSVAWVVKYKKTQIDTTERDKMIQQELASVKGNWLKKQMIGEKLKRQYYEQQMEPRRKSIAKWETVLDWGQTALYIGASPLIWILSLAGIYILLYYSFEMDIKWWALLNVTVAFVSATVLTLGRHVYQAFIMWMVFFLYAIGVCYVGPEQISAQSQWVLGESYGLFSNSNQVDCALHSAYIHMLLASLCFAIYGFTKRWTVPLWLVCNVILVVVDSGVLMNNFALISAEINIVGLYLGTPFHLSFLLCVVYGTAMLMIFCATPAAVEGWRTAIQSSWTKKAPAIVGTGWLMAQVLLLAGVGYALFHGAPLEKQFNQLWGMMVFGPTENYYSPFEIRPDFFRSYWLIVLSGVFASWLVYRYVANNRAKSKRKIR